MRLIGHQYIHITSYLPFLIWLHTLNNCLGEDVYKVDEYLSVVNSGLMNVRDLGGKSHRPEGLIRSSNYVVIVNESM
jgi:hypothetical protein